MKKVFSIAFAACIIIAFCFSGSIQAQEWTKSQQEVWQVVEKSWESWAGGDVEGTLADIHDKYQGWNHEEPLPLGKEKVKKLYTMMKEMMKIEFYNLEPARIAVTDNAAVVDYYFGFFSIWTYGEKTIEKEVKGKNAEFYVKENGKWMLIGDMTVFAPEGD